MEGTRWEDLPPSLRSAIEARTGPVAGAFTVSEGENSRLAVTLQTTSGAIFLKGLKTDDHGVATQLREAAAAPYIEAVSPRLLWRMTANGWDINAFERVEGRHADYGLGSTDLAAVATVMRRLGQVKSPGLPIFKRAETRWHAYFDDPDDASVLSGTALLHTDWNPFNVIITDGGAKIVDWAWATLGVPWLDPACWIPRLIAAGHTVQSAEGWAKTLPAWKTATNRDIDMFAAANARLWEEIAAKAPGIPRLVRMGAAARAWADHRQG